MWPYGAYRLHYAPVIANWQHTALKPACHNISSAHMHHYVYVCVIFGEFGRLVEELTSKVHLTQLGTDHSGYDPPA